jgi:hypothetical protein
MVHVLGQRRVGRCAAIGHDGVGGLGEEERRLALVLAHLADVLEIVASDAPDAAHRKRLVGAGDRNRSLRRWRDDVALVVGGHGGAVSVTWEGRARGSMVAAGYHSAALPNNAHRASP